MSGVIFYFFVAGPKRVEFPIGINDYGSQCNMLYWMYYLTVQWWARTSWEMDETLDCMLQYFQLGKTPRAPFLVDGMIYYIISLQTSQSQGSNMFLGLPESYSNKGVQIMPTM